MSRLVRLYAANFITNNSVLAAFNNLKTLDINTKKTAKNELLVIGNDTWACLSELEQYHDMKPFFEAVRKFCVVSTKKFVANFSFGDSLMKDLGIIQPVNTMSQMVSTLSDPASLQTLKEQFKDFQLSPSDLPSFAEYKAGDDVMQTWGLRQGFIGAKLGQWQY